MIDTGAAWSVVGGRLAVSLEREVTDQGLSERMSMRFGTIRGNLHRLPVRLLAEEGDDIEIDAKVLVAPEWPGPLVLGYGGFLERLRIALDPGTGPEDQWLSFGRPDLV